MSRSFAFVSVLALLWTAPAAAQQQTLILANGDHLTGQLVAVTGGVWTFAHADGKLQVPVAQVAAFAAADPIGVRLDDGTIAAVTIESADTLLRLHLANGSTRTVPPAAIAGVGSARHLDTLRPVAIGLFSPFWRFWGASGSLGFSDKSGNSRSLGLTASVDVQRKTRKDRVSFGVSLDKEASRPPDGTFQETVQKYGGYLRADIYVSPAFFAFAETRQDQDRFQDIRLRSVYNAGLGLQVLESSGTDFRLSASGGVQRQALYSDSVAVNAVGVAGTTLSQALGPATLAWQVDWTQNLQTMADYRVHSTASVTTTIYGGIGVRVGAVNEYANEPPSGIKPSDLQVTTTLTYSIGG